MNTQSSAERMKRYRARQRDEAERHAGKVPLRNVYVTPTANAMLSILSEIYGDASDAIEEAVRRLHASHYRPVTSDVTVTQRGEQPKRAPRPRAVDPGRSERRAAVVRRVKELHAGGMTANAIAGRLNTEGEATLTGRGKWRHSTVQALLAEAE